MTQDTETPGPPLEQTDAAPMNRQQVAEYEVNVGKVRVRASVRVTPVGMLCIGAMVTGILLATSCVVWSGTSAARRRAERRGRSD